MLIRNLSGRMMMKLKKAVKLARARGYSWVAVDNSDYIYAFPDLPILDDIFWCSRAPGIGAEDYIGKYTGKKHWTETLRGTQP